MSSSIARGWSPVGTYAGGCLEFGHPGNSLARGNRPAEAAVPDLRRPRRRLRRRHERASRGIAGLRGRRPEQLTPARLRVLSAATFKAARTVVHDEVMSFLREPFVQGEAHEGDEKPVEDGGTRQAIGELLTCSRCIGMWAAAGVVGVHTVAPRTGRLLTWSLAARRRTTSSRPASAR